MNKSKNLLYEMINKTHISLDLLRKKENTQIAYIRNESRYY